MVENTFRLRAFEELVREHIGTRAASFVLITNLIGQHCCPNSDNPQSRCYWFVQVLE